MSIAANLPSWAARALAAEAAETITAAAADSYVFIASSGISVSSEFVALLNQQVAPKVLSDFERLLSGEVVEISSTVVEQDAFIAAERIAAQAAIDANLQALGVEATSQVALESATVAGSAVLTFGLVLILEAEKLAINYVKKWRLQIAVAVAASSAGAALVSGLSDLLRSNYPDPSVRPEPQPWPDSWPDEDLPRRQFGTEDRFRRMGRKRRG